MGWLLMRPIPKRLFCSSGSPPDREAPMHAQTRALYAPFESDLRSSSSDVYLHEMPGGQYTNLKFQVRLWVPVHSHPSWVG